MIINNNHLFLQNSQNLNNPLSSDAPIQICQTDHLSKKLTSFDLATDDEPVFEPSRKNNFESEHSEIVLNCEPAVRTTSLWDLKPSNPAFEASKSKEKAKLEIDLIPSKNLPVSSSKTSKLKWRPPSQEALNKLHSSLQKLSSLSLTDVNRVPESSDVSNRLVNAVRCFSARFHYERRLEHSLFVLLIFFFSRLAKR